MSGTVSRKRGLARAGLVSIGLIWVVGCHRADAGQPGEARPLTAVKVNTIQVATREVPRLIPLTGTLTAELRTELTANSSGRVVRTFAERGQKVERGALLAQLDVRSVSASAAEAKASLASARTQLEAARAECERYDALIARGAITEQEPAQQTASCKQQLAAVAVSQAHASTASLAVGDGTIRAPFSGVVTERFVSVGDYVQPSSKVVTIVVSNPLRLTLTVPERRFGEIKAGALVTFSPAALPGRAFSGEVKYISGEVRPTTRDIVVEAVVPNADGALLPGMFVEVSLRAGTHPMPVVPKTALFATEQEKSLYAVRDHHLELRIVKPGVEAGDEVALEEGAKPGELVVINPSSALRDDQPVQ
jgi:membrane fusion protein, multidrug efflux system